MDEGYDLLNTWVGPRHGDAVSTGARATGVGADPSDYGSDLSGGGMGSRRAVAMDVKADPSDGGSG